MNEWFKIIVYILERMLHIHKPLFDKPKKISVTINDGIRECRIVWSATKGCVFDEQL